MSQMRITDTFQQVKRPGRTQKQGKSAQIQAGKSVKGRTTNPATVQWLPAVRAAINHRHFSTSWTGEDSHVTRLRNRIAELGFAAESGAGSVFGGQREGGP
ncbi:Hypp661 [Branchiostoma lanceolatum]|uniref:Hypp661 protein n=1 Tax=Branchiostoma lanceolatum TaxID=7740 RepID=A0A8J9VND3_BRALA|nr:Hypp661 [Branchiostoma lanceolatum]